jgi:hypothetical protein
MIGGNFKPARIGFNLGMFEASANLEKLSVYAECRLSRSFL